MFGKFNLVLVTYVARASDFINLVLLCIFAGVPGVTESNQMIDENTYVASIEWRQDVALATNWFVQLKFKAFSLDRAAWYEGSIHESDLAQSESVQLTGPNKQQSQISLISVIQSMPAVVHFTPGEPQHLTLTSEFFLHAPLVEDHVSCYKMSGGGRADLDTTFDYLNSNRVVNTTLTESGDRHLTISLTITVSSLRDEGVYECYFHGKGFGYLMYTSTMVIMDTSTSYLPSDYDYISIAQGLATIDGYGKEGKPNYIYCEHFSSVPGLPTLSLNGTPIELSPREVIIVSRESYVEQYVDDYIDALGPETSGTYTCGSENGSAQQSKVLFSASYEDYMNAGGVCLSLTRECMQYIY